jgi:uncharacterized protein (TIGR02996 family)
MSQLDAFVDAILQEPDAPCHRLVLADWLEEQGIEDDGFGGRPSWLRLNGFWACGEGKLAWQVLFQQVCYRVATLPSEKRPRCEDCMAPARMHWPTHGGRGGKHWFCRACWKQRVWEGSIKTDRV